MKKLLIGLMGIIACCAFYSPPPVHASCEVQSATLTYADGTFIGGDFCDTAGNKKVTTSGSAGVTATATAAAPSYSEASSSALSLDLSGNLRTTLGTLLSGEDQTNNLMMTSGGAARVFTLMTGVTTNSTSSTTVIHSGGKTFMASVTGTGAVSVTVDIYGDMQNTTTNGQWICTMYPGGTTTDTQTCYNQVTKDFPYYHAVTTSISGTSATVEVQAAVGAVGNREQQYFTSVSTAVDAQVKPTPGFLQCIMFNATDSAPVAGTISILDGTSAGATPIVFSFSVTTTYFAPFQICPQRRMKTGIYIDFTTTSDVNVNVSYQ